MRDISTVKAVRERFFDEFAFCHKKWLRELVAKYKASGLFPVLPTQIIDYYPSVADKEIAIFACLCMKWDNGRELEQIADMRRIMGKNPARWFADREFVTLSIGREMDKLLDGYSGGRYWKIAKVFDLLYETCSDGIGPKYPSSVFAHSGFSKFCEKVAQYCEIPDMEYKQGVMELVLRTSDGLGRNLWPTIPSEVRCPLSAKIRRYLKTWFMDWKMGLWTWDEAVSLFKLENDYDFFYAYLGHKELERIDPVGCRRYATRFQSRWEKQWTYKGQYWDGIWRITPKINFQVD